MKDNIRHVSILNDRQSLNTLVQYAQWLLPGLQGGLLPRVWRCVSPLVDQNLLKLAAGKHSFRHSACLIEAVASLLMFIIPRFWNLASQHVIANLHTFLADIDPALATHVCIAGGFGAISLWFCRRLLHARYQRQKSVVVGRPQRVDFSSFHKPNRQIVNPDTRVSSESMRSRTTLLIESKPRLEVQGWPKHSKSSMAIRSSRNYDRAVSLEPELCACFRTGEL